MSPLYHSFSEQPDTPTSLLCFILFTGYLLSRGSNTSCLCFKIIFHQAPIHLSELHLYTPSRHLSSSADIRVFRIPSFRTKSSGQHSFSYQAPVIWNQVPCFRLPFYLCQFFQIFLVNFFLLKNFFFSPIVLIYVSVCMRVSVCVCVFMLYALNFE